MSDTPLRICMVAPLPPPYGGISHWASMVSGHAQRKSSLLLEIVDIAPRWRAIHDQALWKRLLGGTLQTLRDGWQLFGCLRRSHPQVIHLTTSGQLAVLRDLVVMFLARLYSVPVIYHIRFGRVPKIAKKSTCEWFLMRMAMNKSDTIIAIDKETFKALKTYLPNLRVVYVPNCVNFSDLPERKNLPHRVRKVLFIGWVIPTKGIEELIASWAQLQPQWWQLEIVGPGDQDYQQMLIDKYRPSSVVFRGELDHVEAMVALSESDCFVLPSFTEGFPNVVLEAMALAKPIVATSVGAIPEMLDDGCGLLIKPHSIDELKEALQSVMINEKLRNSMGLRAFKKAHSNYSLDVVFEKYMNIWQLAARKG